jgi:hypothetical protein
MLVCIAWKKDGKWKLGRAMLIDRAVELCKSMNKFTKTKHYPCRIAEWMKDLVDWSLPEHLNPKWIKFNKYKTAVNRAISILKKKFKKVGYDYRDFKATAEFELFSSLDFIDDTKKEEETIWWLTNRIVNTCSEIFKESSTDIYNKYDSVSLDGLSVCNYLDPESEVIKEQEEHIRARAFYAGKKLMTKIERKVFNLLERGDDEVAVSNKLRISRQRVNKLKHKASEKVCKLMVEYEEFCV